MKTASWVILAVLGVLVLGSSLLSASVAYGRDWPIGPSTLSGLDAAVPGVGPALRGARGTAAGFGAAYAVLLLGVVLGPYRRRETWAWWVILAFGLGGEDRIERLEVTWPSGHRQVLENPKPTRSWRSGSTSDPLPTSIRLGPAAASVFPVVGPEGRGRQALAVA